MDNGQKTAQPQTTPNERAMAYLQNLADLYLTDKSKSSFLHGLVIGAAQAMMIAGLITADQCRKIEDQTW